MNIRTALVTAALVGITLPLVGGAPALAKDGDIIKRGDCSAAADWKVKAKYDDGKIEVEGEVDSNKVGQTWSWRIDHNGTTEATGTAKTVAPSGSFSVERRLTNRAGVDTFTFRAVNSANGETCKGTVSI
jgi:hypothetical protein